MKRSVLVMVCAMLWCVAGHVRAQGPLSVADSLILKAEQYIGAAYRSGRMGPRAFDCSGFTRFIYSQFGITLPHSSRLQGEVGHDVGKNPGQWQKGDLMVFNGHRVGKNIGHVGLFLSYDSVRHAVRFVHAAIHGGVRIDRLDDPYYARRFLGVRRVLPDMPHRLPPPQPVSFPELRLSVPFPAYSLNEIQEPCLQKSHR